MIDYEIFAGSPISVQVSNAFAVLILVLGTLGLTLPKSKSAAVVAIGLVTIISALRVDVGYDYEAYVQMIEAAENGESVTREYLSRVLMQVASDLDNSQWYFAISAFLTSILIGRPIIKHSSMPMISVLAYVTLPLLFLTSLSTVRQSSAAAIVFYALTMCSGRRLYITLAISVAGLVHTASFLFLPLVFLVGFMKRKYSPLLLLTIFVTCVAVLPALLVNLAGRIPFGYYFSAAPTSGAGIAALYMFLGFILMLLSGRLTSQETYWYNLFVLGVLLLAVGTQINQVVARGAMYLLPFASLLVASVSVRLRPHYLGAAIICSLLCVVYTYQLYLASKDPNGNPLEPYKFELPISGLEEFNTTSK